MDTSRSAPLTPGADAGGPGADAAAGVTEPYRAHADGSMIIGSFVCGQRSRFGAFRSNGFAPLPALPGSRGVLAGTFAW